MRSDTKSIAASTFHHTFLGTFLSRELQISKPKLDLIFLQPPQTPNPFILLKSLLSIFGGICTFLLCTHTVVPKHTMRVSASKIPKSRHLELGQQQGQLKPKGCLRVYVPRLLMLLGLVFPYTTGRGTQHPKSTCVRHHVLAM